MNDTIEEIETELSYVQDADVLGKDIKELHIKADDTQAQAVCDRLNLNKISQLKCNFKFKIEKGYIVKISGDVRAKITQNCVVTLEPIESDIQESFETWYADPDQVVMFDKKKKQKELQNEDGEIPILDEKDDPEPIVDGKIDLGEIAVQFLSLAIDPYPHIDGVDLESHTGHKKAEMPGPKSNPFAQLKAWKDKMSQE